MLSLASNISSTQVVESKYSGVFDGTDDYINLDSFASLLSDDMAFSLSIWFKGGSNTGSDIQNILFSAHNSSYANVFRIGVDADSTPGIFYSDDSTDNHGALGATDLDDGEWHHIILTRPAGSGGQQAKLYIDGGSALTTHLHDVDPAWTSATRVSIGQEYDGAAPSGISDLYEGKIGDIAFWNAELDNNSRLKVYNNGKPFDLTFDQGNYDNSKDLIGYWRPGYGLFDDKANGIIHDQSNAVTGSELITNGTFTSDTSNWTAGSNQIPAESALTIQSNQLKVTLNSGDTFGNAHQAFTVEAGVTYQVVGTLVSKTGGASIKIDKTATSSDPVLLLTTTASATPVTKNFVSPISGTLYVSLTVDDDGGNAVFDNISVKKVHDPGFGNNLLTGNDSTFDGANNWTGWNPSGTTGLSTGSGILTVTLSGESGSVDSGAQIANTHLGISSAGFTYLVEADVWLGTATGTDWRFYLGGPTLGFNPTTTRTRFKWYVRTINTGNFKIYKNSTNGDTGTFFIDDVVVKKLNGNPGLTSGGVTFSSDTP